MADAVITISGESSIFDTCLDSKYAYDIFRQAAKDKLQ